MDTHHIATLLPPLWGHVVGYLHLVVQLLKEDPSLVMTIVQHNFMVDQMKKELSACEYDSSRLRIIGVGRKEFVASDPPTLQLIRGWSDVVPILARGSPWPKPHTIVYDFTVGGHVFKPTKKLIPNTKSLIWFCMNAAPLHTILSEFDSAAIIDQILADEVLRAGRTRKQIELEFFQCMNGKDKLIGEIVSTLGCPDIFDYERLSWAAGPPGPLNRPLLVSGHLLAKGADGYITNSSASVEPVAVPFLRRVYNSRGQTLFAVGQQTHERYFQKGAAFREPITNKTIVKFLDDAYARLGKNSVMYISFGSLFFPTANPKHVEAFVETLIASDFPFIFALPRLGNNMKGGLSKAFIERINATRKGLICAFWLEQRPILQHEATGWFLTHGGINSITEAVLLGIPMLMWPNGTDQPVNAIYFSSGPHPIAIELLQVRTGAQLLGPSLRFGESVKITGTIEDAITEFQTVFRDIRGPKGERLRANTHRVAASMRAGRKTDALVDVRRLAQFGRPLEDMARL
ncbi:Indole-3-acetate beta-glucosyltransferase [Mycena chlorophos]|uniref:Indole-3-acetate beta-glucosyltransferase n=1 Tax=Mycena chlorophos TaxID=658473 RepID=A0A8H6SUJ6_MYCCL|nr:Indole-3-acetate beta-glucosyltransferase [Mycena chlorophos]